MQLLKTKSFELATYAAGDGNADRLALVLPGRLDTKDYAHMRSHVDFFASKGMHSLSFDPPGTWESPGDLSLYTTENYLKAIDELIALFGHKPTVVMGHSRGGSVAMVAGIRNPSVTHFVAVMSHYGPSALGDKAREAGVSTSFRDLPPGTAPTKEKKRFDLSLSYFDDSTLYTDMESCKKPKLFFYGLRDTLVEPNEVRETYEQAAEPKQLCELDSEHDYRYHPDIIEKVNEVVGAFLGV